MSERSLDTRVERSSCQEGEGLHLFIILLTPVVGKGTVVSEADKGCAGRILPVGRHTE